MWSCMSTDHIAFRLCLHMQGQWHFRWRHHSREKMMYTLDTHTHSRIRTHSSLFVHNTSASITASGVPPSVLTLCSCCLMPDPFSHCLPACLSISISSEQPSTESPQPHCILFSKHNHKNNCNNTLERELLRFSSTSSFCPHNDTTARSTRDTRKGWRKKSNQVWMNGGGKKHQCRLRAPSLFTLQ